MKTLLPLTILALFLLGCTETIEIEKLVRDTVFIQRPSLAPSFITIRDTVTEVRTDTVEVQTVITQTDTLLLVVTRDSIVYQIQEKEVEVHDTIFIVERDTIFQTLYDTVTVVEYETRIVYLDTEYIYLFPGQSVTYIPEPFKKHYDRFIAEGNARSKPMPGGDLVVMAVDPIELAGDGWSSDSFEVSGFQWVLRISDQLTVEQAESAIFREMARMQFKKKYVTDATKIMCPWHDVNESMTTQQIDELFL